MLKTAVGGQVVDGKSHGPMLAVAASRRMAGMIEVGLGVIAVDPEAQRRRDALVAQRTRMRGHMAAEAWYLWGSGNGRPRR